MGKQSPLTTRFHYIKNRIDDGMFAINTPGPQGVGTCKKCSISDHC